MGMCKREIVGRWRRRRNFINITFCKQTNFVVFTGVEIIVPFAYWEILRLTEREVTSAISQVCGARVDESFY